MYNIALYMLISNATPLIGSNACSKLCATCPTCPTCTKSFLNYCRKCKYENGVLTAQCQDNTNTPNKNKTVTTSCPVAIPGNGAKPTLDNVKGSLTCHPGKALTDK